MKPFTTLKGRSAPMNIINVDTDMIIPKNFLKTIVRTGLGKNLFNDMRFRQDGSEIADFVLNKAAYRKAQILIAGENFGCGSSREHAPWAILDFGIRCIIAPSFADIFYNNCFKNGILPVVLPQAQVDELMKIAEKPDNEIEIDLEKQEVMVGGNENQSSNFKLQTSNSQIYKFEIDSFRKHCLINGLDDIGLTMEKAADINAYEAKMKKVNPWLWG
jgi:3-isopropylmalate/(R)-2-methylmalate dehydratase small subunit